jgi:hypothetical protein
MKRKQKKPRYYVETWDTEKQTFTPQQGVRKGPYSLFGLRKALKALRLSVQERSIGIRLSDRIARMGTDLDRLPPSQGRKPWLFSLSHGIS